VVPVTLDFVWRIDDCSSRRVFLVSKYVHYLSRRPSLELYHDGTCFSVLVWCLLQLLYPRRHVHRELHDFCAAIDAGFNAIDPRIHDILAACLIASTLASPILAPSPCACGRSLHGHRSDTDIYTADHARLAIRTALTSAWLRLHRHSRSM
jgi:hypothetical protein